MSEKLRIIEVEDRTELYRHCEGQTRPQPVYAEIDPEARTLSMSYRANIGPGQPAAVYHGRLLRTELPDGVVPTAEAANRLMANILDQATALADTYVGWWDGSNYVGRWDEDLRLAWIQKIDAYTDDEVGLVAVWEAHDWFADEPDEQVAARYVITADTTDEDLREISDRMCAEEQCEELDVLEGSLSYCESVRDSLRAARDEEEEVHHASL